MVETKVKSQYVKPVTQEYFIRKLAKSGSSRYLSISTILPKDWEAVKIYVESLSPDGCLLKIIPIR